MADNRRKGCASPLPAAGLMDGLHGPPLTCVCTVICSAMGSCSSQQQLGEEHLLGLRQPEPPASWEERREAIQRIGQSRVGKHREEGRDPGPGLAPTVTLYSGDDAWLLSVPGGILEELCDHGLVTQPL